MTPYEHEQMRMLCGQIAVEQDPRKFMELLNSLDGLLNAKTQPLQKSPGEEQQT